MLLARQSVLGAFRFVCAHVDRSACWRPVATLLVRLAALKGMHIFGSKASSTSTRTIRRNSKRHCPVALYPGLARGGPSRNSHTARERVRAFKPVQRHAGRVLPVHL